MDRITKSRDAHRLLSVRSRNVPQGHDTACPGTYPTRELPSASTNVSRMIDLAPHIEKTYPLSDGSVLSARVCSPRVLTSAYV